MTRLASPARRWAFSIWRHSSHYFTREAWFSPESHTNQHTILLLFRLSHRRLHKARGNLSGKRVITHSQLGPTKSLIASIGQPSAQLLPYITVDYNTMIKGEKLNVERILPLNPYNSSCVRSMLSMYYVSMSVSMYDRYVLSIRNGKHCIIYYRYTVFTYINPFKSSK